MCRAVIQWDATCLQLTVILAAIALYAEPTQAYQAEKCIYNCGDINIDLTGVGKSHTPKATWMDGSEYYINPCDSSDKQGFHPPQCTGAAICMHRPVEGNFYALGMLDSVHPQYNDSAKVLTLSYNTTKIASEVCKGEGRIVKAYVNVICKERQDLYVAVDYPTCTFYFTLDTPYACKGVKPGHGLSTGSILLILFVVVLAVYLLGGVVYKRCVGGAHGVEQIPNIDFWRSFPGLVKDGCRFITSPCRGTAQYDQI